MRIYVKHWHALNILNWTEFFREIFYANINDNVENDINDHDDDDEWWMMDWWYICESIGQVYKVWHFFQDAPYRRSVNIIIY